MSQNPITKKPNKTGSAAQTEFFFSIVLFFTLLLFYLFTFYIIRAEVAIYLVNRGGDNLQRAFQFYPLGIGSHENGFSGMHLK